MTLISNFVKYTSLPLQGERIYNFAGYFNFAIAIGLEMSIIFDPHSDSDPDDLFNINAVPLIAFRTRCPINLLTRNLFL